MNDLDNTAAWTIRPVRMDDAASILAIYSPYVVGSSVSFEMTLPTEEEMKLRIEKYTEKYPWLVAEKNGNIIGYAYSSSYRERLAYQWVAECSVYIFDDFKGHSLSLDLYNKLFELLRQSNIFRVYAVITLPNPASIKFHAKMGFLSFATYEKVGFKLDQWHDVHWMVKEIKEGKPNVGMLAK